MKELLSYKRSNYKLMQVHQPVKLGVLTVVMLIGIIALTSELTQFEDVAKMIVIPSLILLIVITGFSIFKAARQ
jgi:uncharacterized membrane protein YkvI